MNPCDPSQENHKPYDWHQSHSDPLLDGLAEQRAGEARCAEATGSETFLAATITGSNEQKGSEMPAEGKGERQSAGTVSGGSAQAPTISDQKQGTPAGFLPNDKISNAPTSGKENYE